MKIKTLFQSQLADKWAANVRAAASHTLKIVSLHDAMAECSGCGWHYVFTGSRTRQQILAEYVKAHPQGGS